MADMAYLVINLDSLVFSFKSDWKIVSFYFCSHTALILFCPSAFVLTLPSPCFVLLLSLHCSHLVLSFCLCSHVALILFCPSAFVLTLPSSCFVLIWLVTRCCVVYPLFPVNINVANYCICNIYVHWKKGTVTVPVVCQLRYSVWLHIGLYTVFS